MGGQKTELKMIRMSEVESQEVKWLWYPFIPYGKLTIIQGDPGDGKTTLVLNIAAKLSKGESLDSDMNVQEPVNVIYQTAEDGLADTVKPRLELAGADCEKILVIDESDKSLSMADERLEEALAKTGAKVLILDPIQAYLGGGMDMNRANEAKYENRKIELLCELLYELKNEQTIIYFSSPARARKYAKIYCNYLAERESEKKEELPLVAWLEENVSKRWGLVNELKNEIAIHDGSLQKHIGAAIIDYFNDGKLKYIFCTSTIIEGVNTSAKNVVIFDEKKGTNELDFFDYSNIKGRSGRMMEHYVGKVYNFINIPKEEKIVVDIPFYEQNKDLITDEILINIPEKDVKPQVRERYDKIYEISSELLDIIKKNGTSVNGQMSIYYALERDIQNGHYNDISWTRMPEYNKMLYILKLAENNTFTCENNKGILSVKQLTMYLNLYRANGNMMQIIESLYNYKKSKVKNLTAERDSNYYDQAIEEAFHIYRHWFQFTVPKAFRVVDSLQRYVCEKHGKKAGSYSYFVQQLENDFLQENLSILLEYGLPRSLVQKLTKFLPENLTEDEVLNYIIKNKSSIINILTPYEQERLENFLIILIYLQLN